MRDRRGHWGDSEGQERTLGDSEGQERTRGTVRES